MPPELEKLVEDVIEKSRLSPLEKEELRRELTDHVMTRWEVLLLEGVNERDASRIIVSSFGQPDEVGRQMHLAHSRLARIPLIGPIISDPGVVFGTRLVGLHFVAMVILPFFLAVFFGGIGLAYYDTGTDNGFLSRILIMVASNMFLLAPLVPAVFIGRYAGRRYFSIRHFLTVALLSFTPYFVLFAMSWVNQLINGGFNLEYLRNFYTDELTHSALLYVVIFFIVATLTVLRTTHRTKSVVGFVTYRKPLILAGVVAGVGLGSVVLVHVLFAVFPPPTGTVDIQDIQWTTTAPIIHYYDGASDEEQRNYIARADGSINYRSSTALNTMLQTNTERRFWFGSDPLHPESLDSVLFEYVDGDFVRMPLPYNGFLVSHVSESPDARFLLVASTTATEREYFLYDQQTGNYLSELFSLLPEEWVSTAHAKESFTVDIEWLEDSPAILFVIVRDNGVSAHSPHQARFTIQVPALELGSYPLDQSYGPLVHPSFQAPINPYLKAPIMVGDMTVELTSPTVGIQKLRVVDADGKEVRVIDSWFQWFDHHFVTLYDLGDGKALLQINGRVLVADVVSGEMATLFEATPFRFGGISPFDLAIY